MKGFLIITLLILSLLATSLRASDSTPKLQIETIKTGDCARKAEKGNDLLVHYAGFLQDGTEFDSSYKRGEPFSVTLGAGMVIKGWDQGLEGMCRGEIRKLIIPPHLGYGESGYPPIIPEKATLEFKVELVDFGEGDHSDHEL